MERSLGDLQYTLRYDKRSKHIRIKVVPPEGNVVVSCPYFTSIERVEAFLISNQKWVQNARVKVLANAGPKSYLDGGNNLKLFGKDYTVVEKEDRRYSLVFDNDIAILGSPKGADYNKKVAYVKRCYKTIAQKELAPRFSKWQAIINVQPRGFGLRFMRSRWGSCSIATKHVNFSVYAIEKPIEYLDYLVVHELVHLLHPNHGTAFHNAVKKYLPNAERLRKL